jgi:hypothetical protein
VLDALHQARAHELEARRGVGAAAALLASSRRLEGARRGHLGGARRRRHFTHSKVMAWVAFDRGVQAVERFGRAGRSTLAQVARRDPPRGLRTRLRRELNSFTQSYGSKRLDASLLVLRSSAFCRRRPRVLGTVAASSGARPRRLRVPLSR